MTNELFGVYMDTSVAPWAAIQGEHIRAYATNAGTLEGDVETNSNGRFALVGLSDRDDWVPVCTTRTGGILILEAIATVDILTMLTDQKLSVAELEASGLVSVDGEFISIIDDYDAVVDQNYGGSNVSVFARLGNAIAGFHVSIWLRDAGDTDAITIETTDSVQRITGKDADTTIVPVDLTINKDSVTVEQLGFSSKKLILQRRDGIAQNCLFTATGELELNQSGGVGNNVADACRFISVSSATAVAINSDATVTDCLFRAGSGTNYIKGIGTTANVLIKNNRLVGGSDVSGFCIESDTQIDKSLLIGNHIDGIKNGGIRLDGSRNAIIGGTIVCGGTSAAGIRMEAPA